MPNVTIYLNKEDYELYQRIPRKERSAYVARAIRKYMGIKKNK